MAVTRLTAALEECSTAVAELDPEKRAELEKAMALDGAEHYQYQNVQARAFASGRIPSEVATFLYRSLGETGSAANGGWAEGTTLPAKIVATQALAALVRAEITLARAGADR